MTDPLVGTAVAHYEVIAKLGGGGMGVVYTARDVRLGRVVALKFLPPQWSHDESAKQRFLREAQAASATHHRNICTIHDIETAADGQLFIVMAYYEGQTLKQKLEAGPLPIEEAVEIAAQVAEGLAKAHAEGVVHRDIKPGNLIVVEDDVKILDFGLAKFANALQLTMEGSTLGTVAYMSPEQTRGEEADARSDIWAVGVVLYEMLAGALPFKGAYPEAVSHAIRNDPVPPMRTPGRDIPAELTRIVGRALAKDPEERFQSVRELARDLRLLQGRTIPLDLLTAPINAPALRITPPRRWWRSREALAAAAILIIAGIGAPFWLFAPVARVPVVVAPVVNQTGYAELDGYRAALTQELIAELADSPAVRVLPYDRELQILRRFRASGQDISSREAIQALTANSGARIVIAPTLLYENGAWRARVEFRDATTATNAAAQDTAPVVSSLIKDTAYGLMPPLTAAIDAHFVAAGPRRASVARHLLGLAGRAPVLSTMPRLRTLDAAAAFEQGLDAYEQQEHGVALTAFTMASALDARNPLPAAWRSRVARIMRHDDEAADAAQEAQRLLGDDTRPVDALFVQAVAAEAKRDFVAAEARYRDLIDRHPDQAAWVMELAALLDRELRATDAVAGYYDALKLDPRLARPHLELCRLYGPLRLNDPPKAKEEGQLALARYKALGARAGEAQTLWCLADALNVGTEKDRAESQQDADMARQIFEELRYPYNLSRAYNYNALAASAQGRFADAVSFWQRSLTSAREAGNKGLEPAVLTNLSVTYESLGDVAKAVEYRQQGYKLFEALGDQQRAAQNLAFGALLIINYGGNAEQAARDVQNAFGVFEKLGDKNFQVFCLWVLATHHLNTGRQGDAERELNRAIALARESNLDDEIASKTIDLARLRIEQGQYTTARTLLVQSLGEESGPDTTNALIYMGLADTRLGDFETARKDLDKASANLQTHGEAGLAALLHMAQGERAYESGDLAEARARFSEAAAAWTTDLPDAPSVEARAYVGLIDALQGQPDRGRAAIVASVEQARKMGRLSLEARCLMFLARVDLARHRVDEAGRTLNQIPPDDRSRSIGPELRAQVNYWLAQWLTANGNDAAARAQLASARNLVKAIQEALPEQARSRFAARREIHPIAE